MDDSVTTQQRMDGERRDFSRRKCGGCGTQLGFSEPDPCDNCALAASENQALKDSVVAAAVAWAEADDDYLRYATDTTSERYDEALGALKTAVEKLNDAAPPRDAGEGE
jgi:hypothetical protein